MDEGNETKNIKLFNSSKLNEESISYHKHHGFSAELAYYVSTINIAGICAFVSLFGITSNIINVIIFKRQGFQDTVNVTLFATSISDLLSLITTLWVAICYNPLLNSADISFLPMEIQLPTGELPHLIAMSATSWFTAFVTFERCLCIALPLKVKDILTPNRAKVILILIILMVIAGQVPYYYPIRLVWKIDTETNKTRFGLEYSSDFLLSDTVLIYITNVTGPVLSFVIVVICSAILVIKLTKKGKWRQQALATAAKKGDSTTGRDRKVIKLVLAVAVIFIACYTPAVIIGCLSASEPGLFLPTGSLANNYFVAVSVAFVFETVNASVNIFIYYNMSSKYRTIFQSSFLGKQST